MRAAGASGPLAKILSSVDYSCGGLRSEGEWVKVMGASGETTLAERVCQSGNLQGACLEADSRVFNYFRFAALVPVFL